MSAREEIHCLDGSAPAGAERADDRGHEDENEFGTLIEVSQPGHPGAFVVLEHRSRSLDRAGGIFIDQHDLDPATLGGEKTPPLAQTAATTDP